MDVLIIGGGIAGLCLAQGLKMHGIDAGVHDRDASARFRGQGWRLSLKEAGVAALRECLPRDLFDLCRAHALRDPTAMAFMDHHLTPVFHKDLPPAPGAFGLNRLALREILLTGLDVRFGSTFERYEHAPDGRVRAHFGGGATATGGLLVGADGTASAVRGQLLPGARLDDLGGTIYGITPIRTLDWVPDLLVDTFNRVTGPHAAMAIATCRTREPTAQGDYFAWTLGEVADPPARGEALHDLARALVADWHPAVRRIVDEADVPATFHVRLRSALPFEPWDSPDVTLLGDAVHTMSPGRGEGANTALRDARLLTITLAEVSAGRVPLGPAKAMYEEEMLKYGFAAVSASRHSPFAPKNR